jgi:hypothetical protein
MTEVKVTYVITIVEYVAVTTTLASDPAIMSTGTSTL